MLLVTFYKTTTEGGYFTNISFHSKLQGSMKSSWLNLYFFNINIVTELKSSCQLQLQIPLIPNDIDICGTSPSEIHMVDILALVKTIPVTSCEGP
jgi:hypothetical protein